MVASVFKVIEVQ